MLAEFPRNNIYLKSNHLCDIIQKNKQEKNVNFEKIWTHIEDNRPFYIHLSIQADMELDIERRVSKASKDFEYWDADPMSFISTAFRSIRAKGEEDLSLGEAPYIVAYLNKKNIAPPFTKREYNEYVMQKKYYTEIKFYAMNLT